MTHLDDAQLLERFNQRMAAIEAEVPMPPAWQRPSHARSPKWRFQTMFSATKFVVAGAIVALVGGLLLTGVLPYGPDDLSVPAAVTTASASPEASPTAVAATAPTAAPKTSVRADIVPGVSLTVKKVGRGAFRILDDGAGHDLTARLGSVLPIDKDGGLWIESGDSIFRLGDPGAVSLVGTPLSAFRGKLKVAADGTLWAFAETSLHRMLYRLDDGVWVEQPLPDRNEADGVLGEGVSAFDVTPDGRVWVALNRDPAQPVVAVLEDGEWTTLPNIQKFWMRDQGRTQAKTLPAHHCCDFLVQPDGTVWLTSDGTTLRYSGGTWVLDRRNGVASSAVGRDGTLWTLGTCGIRNLYRRDGGRWKIWRNVANWDGCAAYGTSPVVGNDGTLWLSFGGHIGAATDELVSRDIIRERKPGPDAPQCDEPWGDPGDDPGVLSFDGNRWHQYLAGHCVSDVAVARDGSVWVTDTGDERDGAGAGLFVVTPEAVAARR